MNQYERQRKPSPPHPETVQTEMEERVGKLESVLIGKGLVDPEAMEELVYTYEHRIGPRNGAHAVAKAWTDPAYRIRLLTDGSAALQELGYGGRQGEHMQVVENTETIHNMVVCTLCSCYPWPVLGLPPAWYKSSAYRARVVREPRSVLKEFGVQLDEDVDIRVWDSTAEIRYLVLPQQPPNTELLDEQQLSVLVTRDTMIGTALVEAS